MFAASVVPAGAVNVLVSLQVAGLVSVARMLDVAVTPGVAMTAVTVSVLAGSAPDLNLTLTSLRVAAVAPVVNFCATSSVARSETKVPVVCPRLLTRVSAEAAPAPSRAANPSRTNAIAPANAARRSPGRAGLARSQPSAAG